MPENNKPNGDPNKSNSNDNHASKGYLRWIIVGGAIIFLTLIFVSIYLPNLSERVKFFTVNALSLFVLIAIAVQAFIYRRQWEVMREQSTISRAAVNAAESSARAAEESAHLVAQAQRPDIALGLKFADLAVGEPIRMVFEAFNAGRETAYNFGIHISCDWKPPGFDGVLDYGKPNPEAAEPIRPQARRYVHPQWFYPLQPHELFTLTNGTVWFFVYGVLWYEDGAGKRYSEPFCRRFERGSPNDAVECPYSVRSKMVEEIKQAGNETQN